MKSTVKGTFTTDTIAVQLLGNENPLIFNVRRASNTTESNEAHIYEHLINFIEGVRIYPNNEVDLLRAMPGNSGTWMREKTVRIPDVHQGYIERLFGDEVELIRAKKDAVLKYLVDNA